MMNDVPVPQEDGTPPGPKRSRKWIVVAAGLPLVAGLAWLAHGRLLAISPPAPEPESATEPAEGPAKTEPSPSPESPDDRLRRLALGVWHDDYQGKRTMTLNEDGTAVMVVELSGMKAALFAPRLEFDMRWSVENGRLKQHSLGGKPETQVQLILKSMGDRVEQPIMEATPEKLLLLDADGKTKYDWRRAPKEP
jgi:hypothetical protein